MNGTHPDTVLDALGAAVREYFKQDARHSPAGQSSEGRLRRRTVRPVSHELTIMVIDDDAVAVEIFGRMLRDEGYGVQVARDAESGLRDLVEGAAPPSAVLLDLHLPMADGMEFLRRLRALAHLRQLPVTVITGDYFIDEEVIAEAGRLGALVHFKPLWAEDLLQLVRKMLDQRLDQG